MSTAIAGKKLSTKRAEWDVRRPARQSKAHPDCRSTTIKLTVTKISLALSSGRDNHPPAATAEMAILIVAVFPSRLSRYSDRQAEFVTDAYATVGVAYHRAAGLYSADRTMLKLGTAAVHLLTMANSYCNGMGGE